MATIKADPDAKVKTEVDAVGSTPMDIDTQRQQEQEYHDKMLLDSDDDIANDNNNDDGDVVVRELDVFVSPELAKKIYLMQYPLQHRHVPPPEMARIKPKHGLLELENSIPTHMIGTAGNYYLSKRVMQSTTVPIATHMALAKIQQDSIYLVPLEHISQLRPTFEHVDQAEDNTTATDVAATIKKEEEAKKKLEKKPLMFQKKESERAEMIRKSSYAYKKSLEDGEEWIELDVHGPQSMERHQAELNITCRAQDDLTNNNNDNNKGFVHSLDYLPPREGFGNGGSLMDSSLQNQEEGKNPLIPLVQKLVHLLHRGVPVTFSIIRPHFPPTVDNVDLLSALASCAYLVRGNFCLQSRLLTSWEPHVRQARNFVLYLFQLYGHVQRVGIHYVYNNQKNVSQDEVSKESIHSILKQVGLPTKTGWKFRLSDNHNFCEDFPEQTQLHLQFWERQGKRFQKHLQLYQKGLEEFGRS